MKAHQSISRRAFLGVSAAAAGGAAAFAQQSPAKEKTTVKTEYWMHGFKGDDPKALAREMADMGFNVVVAGGEPVIDAVREAGMRSWLCGGAFGLGSHKDDDSYKALDITGKPRVWFGSGSPNHPELRENNLKSYENMAKTEGIEGILVDGCRFASPASGLGAFFTDFSEHSGKKAAELDFDWTRMKKDVGKLHRLVSSRGKEATRRRAWLQQPIGILEWLTQHPGVLDWFRFRRVCATEHFRDIHQILHSAGVKMGVYIFTPSLAPLVGQSYTDLPEFVDVFAPMIYRNYPDRPGIACLNWELSIIPEELGLGGGPDEAAAMELCLRLLGLEYAVQSRELAAIQKAVPPGAVGHETAMARAVLGENETLIPIIYIDDPKMEETAEAVRAAGADGVNFFVYKDEWARMVRPAFSG